MFVKGKAFYAYISDESKSNVSTNSKVEKKVSLMTFPTSMRKVGLSEGEPLFWCKLVMNDYLRIYLDV